MSEREERQMSEDYWSDEYVHGLQARIARLVANPDYVKELEAKLFNQKESCSKMCEERNKFELMFCDERHNHEAAILKIKEYETGHKGACSTCEPVGMLNVELELKLEIAKEALEYYGNRMDSGGTAREALKQIEAV